MESTDLFLDIPRTHIASYNVASLTPLVIYLDLIVCYLNRIHSQRVYPVRNGPSVRMCR